MTNRGFVINFLFDFFSSFCLFCGCRSRSRFAELCNAIPGVNRKPKVCSTAAGKKHIAANTRGSLVAANSILWLQNCLLVFAEPKAKLPLQPSARLSLQIWVCRAANVLSVFAATKIRSSNSRFVATTAHATGDNGLESLVSSSSAGGREKGEECRPLDEDSVEHEER